MESSPFKTAATSQLFRFLVGKDKREFTIHSALLAHQSPALEALVFGKFKESTELCVEWEDIDETTFTSFWQYVYTQDYHSRAITAPASVTSDRYQWPDNRPHTDIGKSEDQRLNETVPEPAIEPEKVDDGWLSGAKFKKKKNIRKQKILWDDFQLSWSAELPVHSLNNQVQETQAGFTTYADLLVHHARVYVLGDRYVFTRLMNSSFGKLHEALIELDLSESTVNDFGALVRFCYKELVPERLKRLVVHYAACHVEILWKNEEFKELVEEVGSLSTALITSMLLRMD